MRRGERDLRVSGKVRCALSGAAAADGWLRMAHKTTVSVEPWSQARKRLRAGYSGWHSLDGSNVSKLRHTRFPEIELVQRQVGKRVAGRVMGPALRLLRKIWNDVPMTIGNN